MEWVNLINKKTPETDAVIKEFRSYMPVNDAKEIKMTGEKDKVDGDKGPDLTLKSRRILSELK